MKAKFGKHTKLLEAILEGDTEDAVEAMREHIEQNRKNVGENFDEFLETASGKKQTSNKTFRIKTIV
jgi:DNA-binding GntR family transcriptional regulator